MGRPEESLEVYRWIRKEDPGFRDVTQRSTGKLEPASGARGSWHTWIEDVYTRSRALKPHVDAALAQTGSWISRQAAQLASHPVFQSKRVESPNAGVYRPPAGMPKSASPIRAAQPAARHQGIEKRRHTRVPVRMRGHFSAKGRPVAGEGELRDLTPWGCRVTSPLTVSVGSNVECCIFPRDASHPFIIDGATVRWANLREFGLAFTSIRPRVQQRIEQLCRSHAA